MGQSIFVILSSVEALTFTIIGKSYLQFYLKVAQATPKDRQIWLKKGGLSKAE